MDNTIALKYLHEDQVIPIVLRTEQTLPCLTDAFMVNVAKMFWKLGDNIELEDIAKELGINVLLLDPDEIERMEYSFADHVEVPRQLIHDYPAVG